MRSGCFPEVPKDLFSVRKKVIAIVGACGLLGTQYVEFLSSLGAIVVIGDVDIVKCKTLEARVSKKYNVNALALSIDNTDENSIAAFFQSIQKRVGKLDVLINNAQAKPEGFYAPFEKYLKTTLSKVLDANLVGTILCCQAACKLYLSQGHGVIINVASIYGMQGADQRIYEGVKNPYQNNDKFSSPISYAVSKAGILNLTRYLAAYYQEKNIRVNSLTPGGVLDSQDKSFVVQYSYRTLLGRMAFRHEYNGAILFLASDASSYMTGANLVIDGGWTAI